MTTRTEIECNENTSLPVTAEVERYDLATAAYVPITLASIDSIEVTLVNLQTNEIVNSRQKQDALNTGDFTMHATSGLFTWEVQPEDTVIEGPTPINQRENHLATFTVIWDTDKQMHFEILLKVLNLRNVPQVAP